MATPREKDAAEYVEKHKIIELMDNMTSMLLFYRPENQREFLIEQLEQLKTSRESGVRGPNLFDSSDLDAVFGILDPANQKYITFAQYKQALTMLGIKDINECPDSVNEDRISHETFKTERWKAYRELQQHMHSSKSFFLSSPLWPLSYFMLLMFVEPLLQQREKSR